MRRLHALPLLAALAALAACGDPPGVRPGADVLLVVVDTLRADALSCYGNPRPTTPALDRLAARGARFEECLAQAPNTATSHATLFTGLHPWAHRVANLTSLELGTPGLPDAFETLAERFRAAGYRTVAVTDGGPLGTTWNLCQGFDVLEARYEGARAKVDAALRALDRRGDEPLFLFVHTYQVHMPYAPPEGFVERFDPGYEGPLTAAVAEVRAARARGEEPNDGKLLLRDRARFAERDLVHLRALYDAELAYTDGELARLLERVEREGGFVVAVTSDHGEEFLEHGELGHVQLHRETLRVPLLLALPDGAWAGTVVAEPVGLVDLFATLCEAAGLPAAAGDSRSLLPLLAGRRRAELPLFAETTEHLYADRPHPWRRAVRSGGSTYLSEIPCGPGGEARGDAAARLYDAADPGEERELLAAGGASARARAEGLAALLERHLERQAELRRAVGEAAASFAPPGPETAAELRALGYAGR